MGEDWVAQVLSDRWFPAAVAYFLGLFTGWLIWSGAKAGAASADGVAGDTPADGGEAGKAEEKSADDTAKPAGDDRKKLSGPIAIKIKALESEIKKAREMLAEDAEENAAFSNLISSLDEAVKRANGRLKLIIKSVKRAKPDKE